LGALPSAQDEDDDFHGFGFSGEGAAEEDSGDRALARSLFTQHDADGNGALDAVEVQHFARQMGLKLSAEEAAEAVGEMELATKKDGMVEFDEFWHWSVLSPPAARSSLASASLLAPLFAVRRFLSRLAARQLLHKRIDLTEMLPSLISRGLVVDRFTRKRVGMEPGSVAYRMIQAREQAFQQEMGAQSPMGRMLAAKAGGGAPTPQLDAAAALSFDSC